MGPAGAFSIPNRIEPSATICIGIFPVGCVNFQYPQSDRALCNFGSGRRRPPMIASFSIPNRIEPSATNWLTAGGLLAVLFQYPQSDRALCNRDRLGRRRRVCALSVSPIGSSPLQPIIPVTYGSVGSKLSVSPIGSSPLQLPSSRANATAPLTFSIPNRIEPSATLR